MTLAELVVNLSANTASLSRDFNKAHRMAQDCARSIKSALSTIGVGLSITGLVYAVKQAADYGDEIQRAGQKTAMSAREISGLGFAAKQVDIEFDSLQKGLIFFEKNLAGMGGQSDKFQRALKALGLSADEINPKLHSVHEILLTVASAFATHANTVGKAGISTALFGRQLGAELIPFLNMGAAGIELLEKRGAQLGRVLTDEVATGAGIAHDEIKIFEAALKGWEFSLVAKTFPALSLLMELFLGNAAAIAAFSYQFELAIISIGRLGAISWRSLRYGKNDVRDYDVVIEDLKNRIVGAYSTVRTEQEKLAKLMGGPAGGLPGFEIPGKAPHKEKAGKETADPYLKNLRSIAEALLESWDPTIKAAFGMEQLNQAWAHGLISGDELSRGIQDIQAGLLDLDPIVKLHREEWRKAGEVWVQSQADLDAVAKSLKDSLQTPAEKATASFRELVLLLGTGRITPAQFTLATGKLEQGLSHAGELAHQLGTEMQSAFSQMIIYGRDFGDCLKGLIQLFAEFILKTYVFKSIAGAFSGSWIGSFFGALAGMQEGGGVSAGTPYLVGEAGPELFVPGAAGSIVPLSNVGGDTYSYVIDARGADPSVEPRLRRMLRELHADAVERAQTQMREQTWRAGT